MPPTACEFLRMHLVSHLKVCAVCPRLMLSLEFFENKLRTDAHILYELSEIEIGAIGVL